MVHGIEPLFPFDLSEVTFLVPMPNTDDITTPILITWRACQLQKCREDIDTICEWVLLPQFVSLRHFEQQFKNWICQQDFHPGNLILVHNSRIEKELNRKTKSCYLGQMVVFCRTTEGSYLLAKLEGAISCLQCLSVATLLSTPTHCYTGYRLNQIEQSRVGWIWGWRRSRKGWWKWRRRIKWLAPSLSTTHNIFSLWYSLHTVIHSTCVSTVTCVKCT